MPAAAWLLLSSILEKHSLLSDDSSPVKLQRIRCVSQKALACGCLILLSPSPACVRTLKGTMPNAGSILVQQSCKHAVVATFLMHLEWAHPCYIPRKVSSSLHCQTSDQQRCMQSRPGMWNFILEPEEAGDELEHFQDAPDSDADDPAAKPAAAAPRSAPEGGQAPGGTLGGAEGAQGGPAGKLQQPAEEKQGPASYDMRKR